MEVEAGAYFKKGDVLISTLGNPFIYNGIINREGDMGCIYGIGYNMCRETKKKLLQAIKGVNVEEEDVSLYTTGGWD